MRKRYAMNHIIPFIVSFLLLFWTSRKFPLQAHPESNEIINHITENEGLQNETVFKIAKDSKGMIWVGTFNGILSFNGQTFKPYPTDLSKPFNAVTDIIETHDGVLLFGTRKGLYKVDTEQDRSIHVCPQIDFVNTLCRIGETVMIGSMNGLWIYHSPQEAESIVLTDNIISKGNTVNDIIDDHNGGAWLCTNDQLIHLNLKSKELTRFSVPANLLTGKLRCLCLLNGQIFIGTLNSGLLIFDPATGKTTPYLNVGCPVISDLNSDGKYFLYVATDGYGAYTVDTQKQTIIETFRTDTPKSSIPSNTVYTFWHDESLGINWFGFATDGLCYNYHQRPLFSTYRYKDFDTQDMFVRSFCIHGDDKVIGTRDGLYFISEKRNIIRYFTPEELGGRIVTDIKFFSGHFVVAIYEKGICTINPETLELSNISPNNDMQNGNFSVMDIVNGEQLFACSNIGIFVIDKDFRLVKHYHSRNSGLPDYYINDFLFDQSGKGWIGTGTQLAIYDPKTQTITSRDFPEGYFANEANLTFNLCRNGDVIAASETNVFRTKSDLSHYSPLDFYQQLDINRIFFIKENRNGQYWIGTDLGLFLFEKDLKHYHQFNENDNLPSSKFSKKGIQESNDGTFWFGTNSGLTYITPTNQQHISAPVKGKVTLDAVYINGKAVPEYTSTAPNTISMRWNFSGQTLDAIPILLDYGKPEGRFYEWQLDNGEWHSVKDGEEINTGKLFIGRHTLKIRLAGHEETASTFQIAVWPSAAFYLEILLVVMTTLSIYYLKRLRNKRARLKAALRRKHRLDMEIAMARGMQQQQMEQENQRTEAELAKAQSIQDKTKQHQNEYKTLYKKIQTCMEEDKLYVNPDLRLTDLAAKIGCTPTKLSQMFNHYLHQNFFDFINAYRVEEFKRKAVSEKYSQYTMVAISETCGFKRSTFFATFKKFEHCTPAEFLNRQGINKK